MTTESPISISAWPIVSPGPGITSRSVGAERSLVELDRLLRAVDREVRRDGVVPLGHRLWCHLLPLPTVAVRSYSWGLQEVAIL